MKIKTDKENLVIITFSGKKEVDELKENISYLKGISNDPMLMNIINLLTEAIGEKE